MLFKIVILCLFWRFVPRESAIFEITVGLAQKKRKENKACNLEIQETPTRSNISTKKSYLPDSLTQKIHGPRKNSVSATFRPNLSSLWSRIRI